VVEDSTSTQGGPIGGMQRRSIARDLVPIGIIIVIALLLRLLFVFEMRSSPTFDSPLLDPSYHDRWALHLAQGDWFGGEVFFRAPLYPYFLGLIYRVVGHSYLIPRIIQACLGVLSCCIVAAIGTRLFGRRIGLTAAACAAVYGPLIYFEGELLIAPLFVFLALLALWTLLLLGERPSAQRWVLSGVVLGLAAIARPNILLFAVLLPVWALIIVRRKLGTAGTIRGIGILAIGIVTVVAPVTARNWIVGHDFVPIASQGGVNFYLGNNPWADGMSAIMPGVGSDWDEVAIAERDLGRELRPSEISRYWWRQGVAFAGSSPGAFLKLSAKKILIFWNGIEVSNNQNIYFFRRYSRLLSTLMWRRVVSFPFGIVAPLALIGMAISLGMWRRYFLLYLFVIAYGLSVVLFFVTSRHRLPTVPVLLLFAGAAVWWLAEKVLRQEWGKVAGFTILFVLLAVAANVPVAGVDVGNFAQSHFNMGNVFLRDGELDRARAEYLACLEIEPRFPLAHLNLGVTYYRAGALALAREAFIEEIEVNPGAAGAHNNLGLVFRDLGDPERAVVAFSRALALDPGHHEAARNLSLVLRRLHREEEAIAVLERAISSAPRSRSLRRALADLYDELGLRDLAEQQRMRADSLARPFSPFRREP